MKPWLLIKLIILLVVLPAAGSYAQTQLIDSLKRELRSSSNTAKHLKILFALCEERTSLHGDSLYAYALEAQKLAEAQKIKRDIISANYYRCNALLKKSLFDSVISESDKQLAWLEKNDASQQEKNNFEYVKAQALVRNNQFKEALTQYNQLLSHAEAVSDTNMQMRAKTGIGWIHMEMNQNGEALHWFRQALATTTNQQLIGRYGVIYCNMASVYSNLNQMDSAAFFVDKALDDAHHYQQLTNLANALYIQSVIFIDRKNNTSAEKALKEALEVRRRIGDPFYIVSDMAQISSFYANSGQYAKGIEMARQGIDFAQKRKLDAKLPMLYTSLGENLRNQGNYEAYSGILDTMLQMKDSLYVKNSAEAIADLQARYDLQRKENIIIQKNLDIIRRDYLLYAILGIFAFLVVLFFILYQNYQKRQKLVMEKMLKEQQQRETIAILKAEEKERKRIAADLHDNLGAYAAAISANVKMLNNAGNGSQKLTQQIEENVEGMVNQLGDTIWVLKKPNQLLTEVSDRFKVWLQRQMHNFPNIRYDVEEQITTDPMLSAACVLHLFYMMQECVSNAVRHSQCHQIAITLNADDKGLLVDITDDGTGFEHEKIRQGNGLGNVKQRAAVCNWFVTWRQNPAGKGTSVLISDQPIASN